MDINIPNMHDSKAPPPPPPPPQYCVLINGSQIDAQRFINEVSTANAWKGSDTQEDHFITCAEERVGIQHLRRLVLCNVRLPGIDNFMGRLTMLTHVNLAFNRITEISDLAMLFNLQMLDLSHNKIASIDPLRQLTKLRSLKCNDNVLESLEPVWELLNLSELWVSDNNIQWQEFIYLNPLIKLKTLVKLGNPCEGKDKLLPFVKSLCPTLRMLDGVDLVAEVADERFNGDYQLAMASNARESQAFLRSTDGRVMLAQAQAHLPRLDRDRLQAAGGVQQRLEANVQEFAHNSSENGSAGVEILPPAKGKNEQHHRGPRAGAGYVGLSAEPTVNQAISSATGNNETSNTAAGIRSSGYGQPSGPRPPSLIPTIDRKPPKRPHSNVRRFVPSVITSEGLPKSDEKIMHVSHGINNDDGEEKNIVFESPVLRKSAQLPPMQILRFGDNVGDMYSQVHSTEEASVALCLYSNADGYARWQRGPVAVSMETGRLFGSYKNGVIAVVHDAEGNGSVMDPNGHNVLLLMSSKKTVDGIATAKVLETRTGRLVTEYRQNAAMLHVNPTQSAGPPDSDGSPGTAQETRPSQTWKFGGLRIEFYAETWDLRVRFANERMVCEFSSRSGGRLLKEKVNDIASSIGNAAANKGLSGKKGVLQESVTSTSTRKDSSSKSKIKDKPSPLERFNKEDHEAVRRDVNSIIGNLDRLLTSLDHNNVKPI